MSLKRFDVKTWLRLVLYKFRTSQLFSFNAFWKKSLSGNWVGAKVPNTHKNPAVGASLILDKHSCQLRSTTYLNQPIKDHQDVGPHNSCIHYK